MADIMTSKPLGLHLREWGLGNVGTSMDPPTPICKHPILGLLMFPRLVSLRTAKPICVPGGCAWDRATAPGLCWKSPEPNDCTLRMADPLGAGEACDGFGPQGPTRPQARRATLVFLFVREFILFYLNRFDLGSRHLSLTSCE